MAKKDFKAASTNPTYQTIIGAAQEAETPTEAQKVQDAQETHVPTAQETLAALKTQGQKGVSLPRINMAFTPDNYDFIRIMSKLKGQTMTQYVNVLIAAEREKNGDTYEAAKTLIGNL